MTQVAAATAKQPELEVQIPTGPWTVGDPVPVTLTVRLPAAMADITPRFPAWQDHWGEAEIVSISEPQRTQVQGDRVEWTQQVIVAAFRPGRIDLPPREIVVPLADESRRLSSSADLHLELRSVLPTDVPREKLQPRDPAALRSLPLGAAFWWTLAIGLLLLAAALAAAKRRRPAPQEAAPAPLPEPRFELEIAFAELAEETNRVRFHAGLSRALRRYLGRTAGFPALESTTREIRRRLLAIQLPGEAVRAGVELLGECDGVKFARRTPRAARQQLLAGARALADRVEEHMAHRRELERRALAAAADEAAA